MSGDTYAAFADRVRHLRADGRAFLGARGPAVRVARRGAGVVGAGLGGVGVGHGVCASFQSAN